MSLYDDIFLSDDIKSDKDVKNKNWSNSSMKHHLQNKKQQSKVIVKIKFLNYLFL